MILRFRYAAVLIPGGKPFFKAVGGASVRLLIPRIEQVEALVGKLPPGAIRIIECIRAQADNDMSGPPLSIVRWNAVVWEPEVWGLARCPVDIDTYERERAVSRSKQRARCRL